MKLIVFSDPHNSDTPPRNRHEGYCEQILKKQEYLIQPSKEVDLVVCTGDVFHSKRTDKVSYRLMNRICEIYREFPRLLIVPGNHDIDTRMDWSDRPLGILEKLPNVKIVHDAVIKYEGFNIVFKGWGGGEFFSLNQLVGFMEDKVKILTDYFRIVAVIHASVAEDKTYPFDCIEVSQLMPYCDYVLLGHLHDFQSVGDGFMSTGAFSRGVLSLDANLLRPVLYGWVDIQEDSITHGFNEIPVKPAEEVFKVEKKQLAVKQREQVDAFVEFIQNFSAPKSLNKEDAVQYVRQLTTITEEVRREAIRVLEGL